MKALPMDILKNPSTCLKNEKGFVLITSLLILVVVMIIGIAATNTSILELQISGNDRLTKETFYAAEGGLEVGIALIELGWVDGVLPESDFTSLNDGEIFQFQNLYILSEDYRIPHLLPDESPEDTPQPQPQIFFSYGNPAPNTNVIPRVELWLPGTRRQMFGSSLIQLAGYSGAGTSAAAGGVGRMYDVHSIAYGPDNSISRLVTEWLHLH